MALKGRPGLTGPGWWALTAAVLVLGTLWAWASRVPAAEAGLGRVASPREGFPAPPFALEALDGTSVALADLRGRVVVVNLWASWCGPCRAEMPALQRLYAAQRAEGLEVLAVNSTVQDSEAAAREFARSFGLTFPVLLDRAGEVSDRYRLRALPSTFFIGRDGVIRAVIVGGPLSEAVLRAQVADLLAEAAP